MGLTRLSAAVVGTLVLVGAACADDSAGVATEPNPGQTAELWPLAPTWLPDDFQLMSVSDSDDWGDETAEVYGLVGVDDPFTHPLVLHIVDPAAPPVTVPGGESVELGSVPGRVLEGIAGPDTHTVLWTDGTGNHNLTGFDVGAEPLVELATALVAGESDLPGGWTTLISRHELAASGGALDYQLVAANPDEDRPALRNVSVSLIDGDDRHLGLFRVLRSREACRGSGGSRCSEPLTVRGHDGLLDEFSVSPPVDTGGAAPAPAVTLDITTVAWAEPGGWVVALMGYNVGEAELLQIAESLQETTWDALRSQVEQTSPEGAPDTTIP